MQFRDDRQQREKVMEQTEIKMKQGRRKYKENSGKTEAYKR